MGKGKDKDKMFGRKKKNRKGLYPTKKEGKLKQEMLEGEDTLQTMKKGAKDKNTILMKSGHRAGIMRHMKGFAKYDHDYKKTDARIARDYAANAAYDDEHGYKSEGKYEAEEAVKAMMKKKGGMFGNKTNPRTGLVKGTKRNARKKSRG